ncbi:MAG: L-glutamate gamma-semialdehyde dehydrogenase [Deltaproteobacteria bacterium]|nr:L-glutamate gamma-semialdehyde dehydrogenase [Deltaproteobacteria bacterium]
MTRVDLLDMLLPPFLHKESLAMRELKPFQNEPMTDFSKPLNQNLMREAIDVVRSRFGREYLVDIGGRKIATGRWIDSLNPSLPSEKIGRVAVAGTGEAQQAVAAASRAFESWREVPPSERAEFLLRAAEMVRKRRFELAALIVLEAGKQWREADADVAEAIDFLEYYAREMLRLAEPRRMGNAPGEVNLYFYEPRGVAVVISPWNFPLAIAAGMTSAALVTGNTVVFKPAEQTSVMGAYLTEIYRESGIPKEAFHYLPGIGEEVGAYLVEHPSVDVIVFTGSKEVGLQIIEKAAMTRPGQKNIKRVVAEMGGKNAIIVDSDADLDEAVLGTVRSAFGYQGQKCSACSRAIVLEDCYNIFVERLVEAVKSLTVGPADDPKTVVGPLIDESALRKVRSYIGLAEQEGTVLLKDHRPAELEKSGGYYAGPTIVAEVKPDSRLAQEEIFGPVLSVIQAKNFAEALEIAVSTEYALTGGLFSRSPAHIEEAQKRFRVGNLYINRPITGALVERQPFGGFKMSGVGSKAGGPDYLLQFMEPRTVTENTMRRGFAPQA